LGETGSVSRRILLLFVLLNLLIGCGDSGSGAAMTPPTPANSIALPVIPEAAATPGTSAHFVGSNKCIRCHPDEGQKWRGSHHDRAMEEANSESVEARFDGAVVQHADQLWRFVQDEGDDSFVIEVDSEGQPKERLTVAYTFGVEPLQQYLVTRPDGRLQAPPVAWDTRPRAQGGQRWIDLQPEGELVAAQDDPLHWDRLAYNWNSQCAACHSTQLSKGYDEATKAFETTWAEIDVGCEACHGPGSVHTAEVERSSPASGFEFSFEPWSESLWHRGPQDQIAFRAIPRTHDRQLDVCAPCHSRRTQIATAPVIGAPFLDGYRPRLLDPELYFPDGQIRDEVYVWGSFLQSRMYAAGVRCSDCHDSHSLSLRRSGVNLCTGCHDQDTYASSEHHGHVNGTPGSRCVDCHMPERVYMKVDGRRDHSFPIPRPERKQTLRSPNACQNCHEDRDADWATRKIASWRAEDDVQRPHWTDPLVAGTSGRAGGAEWIEIATDASLTPIARANAWARLAEVEGAQVPAALLRERLRDASDLERMAMVEVMHLVSPEARVSLLRPLLEDPRLAVRIAAGLAMAQLPPAILRPVDRSILARVLREYRGAQDVNAERPEAQVNLGILSVQVRELETARTAYQRALELAPYFVPAYVNLADLERMLGDDEASVGWLRQALTWAPDEAVIHYALGLALHRLGAAKEALVALTRAAQTEPRQARFILAWSLALDASGQRSEAVEGLGQAIDTGYSDASLFHALVAMLRDEGDDGQARLRAEQWLTVWPADTRARALLRELEGRR